MVGKTFLTNWYNKNKEAIEAAYRKTAQDRAALIFNKDATYTVSFDDNAFDGLEDNIL